MSNKQLVCGIESIYSNNPNTPTKHELNIGYNEGNYIHHIFTFTTQKDMMTAFNIFELLSRSINNV